MCLLHSSQPLFLFFFFLLKTMNWKRFWSCCKEKKEVKVWIFVLKHHGQPKIPISHLYDWPKNQRLKWFTKRLRMPLFPFYTNANPCNISNKFMPTSSRPTFPKIHTPSHLYSPSLQLPAAMAVLSSLTLVKFSRTCSRGIFSCTIQWLEGILYRGLRNKRFSVT